MNPETAQVIPGKAGEVRAGGARIRLLAALAVVVFAAGVGLADAGPLVHAAIAFRWIGIALFAAYAIRRRSLLV